MSEVCERYVELRASGASRNAAIHTLARELDLPPAAVRRALRGEPQPAGEQAAGPAEESA